MRSVTYSDELPVPQPSENVVFCDNTSDSDEDHERQGGAIFIVIRRLKHFVRQLNLTY